MLALLKKKETILKNSGRSNKGRCSGGCTKMENNTGRGQHASMLVITIHVKV
jgi:hypothetical protein